MYISERALDGFLICSNKVDKGLLYLTPFDMEIYRRPIFAKTALPELAIINYVKEYARFGSLGKILNFAKKALEKAENILSKTPRYHSGNLASARFHDFLYSLTLRGIKVDTIITLNTQLTSKLSNHGLIVDLMDMWMWPWDEINLIDIQALENADGVIFWSRPLLDVMSKRIRIKSSTYVPCGINLEIFDPIKFGNKQLFRNKFALKNKFILTYSGGIWRLDNLDLQGIDKVLRAFEVVAGHITNSVLVLQLLNLDIETLRLLKKLGIEKKTLIIGKQTYASINRLNLFSATDLFVAPTSRHPMAYYAERMKFFQYMAAGKSIVTEEAPGTRSVFANTAHYVQLDSIDEMAEAIIKLHDNEDEREELSQKCRKRVETVYNWSKIMQAYKDFVLSVSEKA